MESEFTREEALIGAEGLEILKRAKVAVFGIGGVGGYAAEALGRSGIGHLVLVDSDRVEITNINRQILALHSTLGRYKTEVCRERILDINPEAEVEARTCFYLPETADQFDFTEYSYVVDAVDTVAAKMEIISRAAACRVPVISSMGAGNKLDPTQFHVADIYETSMCPLAKVIRRECRKRGIEHLKVGYSTEKPVRPVRPAESGTEAEQKEPVRRKDTPGSIAFVPPAAGLFLASVVVRDLLEGGMRYGS